MNNPLGAERRPIKPIVAVIDTSALYGDRSRRALVLAANEGLYEGVWSPHVIGELYRILTVRWIEKYGLNGDSKSRLSRKSKDMMDVLLAAFSLVDTGPLESEDPIAMRDPDDFHLVRAARFASAGCVVSENTRDFPPKDADGRHRFEGIEFLTVNDFLASIVARNRR